MQAMDLQPHLINAELLPESLQELSEVVGLDAALKLAAAYPSVPLYVPSKARPDHAIAEVIGPGAFECLVNHYGGDTITVAKIEAATRQIKHHMLKDLKKQGHSNRDIALQLNYSQRHVERITSGLRDENQFDMFEE